MSRLERWIPAVLAVASSVGVVILSVAAAYTVVMWLAAVADKVSCTDTVCRVAVVGAVDSAMLLGLGVLYCGVRVALHGLWILRVTAKGFWAELGEVVRHGLMAFAVAALALYIIVLHSVAVASLGIELPENLGVAADLGGTIAMVAAAETITAIKLRLFSMLQREREEREK